MKNKFYVTTPIYYVNAQPHLGHTYTTIAADVLARYHRMIGDKTFFLTGTDEHGAKIEEKAGEAGMEPQQFADAIAAKFMLAWEELNISNDSFIRTTYPAHKKAVQVAMQRMYDNGDIYKSKYEGLYCVGCEQFKNEKDLIDGKCPDHKIEPIWMSEEAYMFKLSKYQEPLLEKIKNDELKIRPIERKNEMISFFGQVGLNDVAFSRTKVKWGIPVPWDESHTIYVWADAFLNYLTGLGWQGEADEELEFWPAEVQLIGKDILRVHTTIWPAMLLSLGLPVQKQLFTHGFFLSDGQKMSKSIGNVIAPEDLVKKYGVDGTRYLLMTATTFGNDGDITWKFLDEKYNADLANGLGNLVSRVITMAINGYESKIPAYSVSDLEQENKKQLMKFVKNEMENYVNAMGEISIDKALSSAVRIISYLDKDITDLAPWKVLKNNGDDKLLMKNSFYSWLEAIRLIAWMIWPFMPEIADKIWESLGLENEKDNNFKKAIEWGRLEPGTQIKKPESLFPRI